MDYSNLIEKAEKTHQLTKSEIVALLSNELCQEELVAAADRVRAAVFDRHRHEPDVLRDRRLLVVAARRQRHGLR